MGNAADRAIDDALGFLVRFRNRFARKAILFLILLAVYLVIAMSFKMLAVIPGFTDVRPVEMLQPAYGIFFGIPGCLSFAFGNLIGDILSDGLRWSSIAGFIASFAYPYLMYLFWCKLRKEPFSLRRGRMIALMTVTIIAFACLQALIIAPSVAVLYPDVNAVLLAISVAVNGTVFRCASASL